MLKANFTITETGGTGVVQLQSSADAGATWQDVGSSLTLSGGALTVDDSTNLLIDTSVYIPGQTYQFRLIDTSGTPVSHVYTTRIPSITGYAAAEAIIGFQNTGGDNWTVLYQLTPSSIQNPDGAAITSIDWQLDFGAAGAVTYRDNGSATGDHTLTASHGSGVYVLSQTFHFSDGEQVLIGRIVKVDASGNILGDIQYNGLTVNSVSGLTIDVTAAIVQSGVSETVYIDALDHATYAPTQLGTGLHYVGTIPSGTGALSMSTSLYSDILE
jgi:hypothetical protein